MFRRIVVDSLTYYVSFITLLLLLFGLKMVSLIYFIVLEINILIKFR